ncbi:hypothetical protein [Leifsonia sp. NPDC058248]|uniref:hypothetical protein n=1 Tax=Leifsonia sp. NPDC058248 TaxID=3346402 RepID=UPI0036DAC056
MTMNSFTLNAADAKYLADVGLSASSADDVTPVICAAMFYVTETEVRVVSTDRYRIHTAIAAPSEPAPDHEVLIDRTALTWMSKNANALGRQRNLVKPIVTITSEPADPNANARGGALTITVTEWVGDDARTLTYTAHTVKGNFPPVMRLVQEARDAEESEGGRLKLDFLAKARPLAMHPDYAPRIKFTKATTDNSRPGPALLQFKNAGVVYAEAIIQPYLIGVE